MLESDWSMLVGRTEIPGRCGGRVPQRPSFSLSSSPDEWCPGPDLQSAASRSCRLQCCYRRGPESWNDTAPPVWCGYKRCPLPCNFPLRFSLCRHSLDFRQQRLNVCVIPFPHNKTPRCSLFSYIRGSFVTARFYWSCSFFKASGDFLFYSHSANSDIWECIWGDFTSKTFANILMFHQLFGAPRFLSIKIVSQKTRDCKGFNP